MTIATTRTHAGAARAFLLVVAAVSVGVHAGLAPEHLHEWAPLGGAFIAAAAAVAAAAVALALCPTSAWPVRSLGVLLASLVAAYAATRLIALPPLDPTREPLDVLGVCTSALEAAGVPVAIVLGWPRTHGRPSYAVTPGGTA